MVGQTSDAHTAVDSVRRLSPDVVIMDIMLDEGNGIDVLRTIKRFDPAPVVFVFTNYTYAEYKERWMQEGADFFFSKSSDFRAMLESLRAVAIRARQGSVNS